MADSDAATARQIIDGTFAQWRARKGDTVHDWAGLANALLAEFRAAGFPLTLPEPKVYVEEGRLHCRHPVAGLLTMGAWGWQPTGGTYVA